MVVVDITSKTPKEGIERQIRISVVNGLSYTCLITPRSPTGMSCFLMVKRVNSIDNGCVITVFALLLVLPYAHLPSRMACRRRYAYKYRYYA